VSLFLFRGPLFGVAHAGELIPARGGRSGVPVVTNDTALRHSAVWACLRLRADLMSTFPCDVFRKIDKSTRVEVPKPLVLVNPGGERWDYQDWMYASQWDLDRAGNAVGLVTERDAANRAARIDLAALSDVSVIEKRDTGELRYRINGTEYGADKVWHERQYVVPGLPMGLSPVAYAAWVIGEYLSIQHFANDWFGRGSVPAAHLRNTQRTIPQTKAETIKQRFKESVAVGEPFVSGSDWEYKPLQAEQMGMEWLEGRKYGTTDIARFFGCPADLIDSAVSGSSVTYANITQRNLQFLIMQLGPAVSRREKNLTKLTAKPRYVKLNTDALLRMDPTATAEAIKAEIEARTLTNSEARALKDRPPLTQAEIDEFTAIYGAPRTQPITAVS
jgi:HK97 family phage portal protein